LLEFFLTTFTVAAHNIWVKECRDVRILFINDNSIADINTARTIR
jgi:hypothetical protein